MKLNEYQISMSFSDLGLIKLNEYQKSMSFSDLGQQLLSHSKPDFIRTRMKVYINEFCHMTNKATMPIYGKNLL